MFVNLGLLNSGSLFFGSLLWDLSYILWDTEWHTHYMQVAFSHPSFDTQDVLISHSLPPIEYHSYNPIPRWPPAFLAPGTSFVEDNFFMDWGCGGGLGMIQARLLLLCTLLLLYQLCLKSSGIRSRVGDPCYTVSPLRRNEFHSKSVFVRPVCS